MNKSQHNEEILEIISEKMAATGGVITPDALPKEAVVEIYCECVNRVCEESIRVAYDEYLEAKRTGDASIVKPEHYLPEFERVVRKKINYWIVIKRLEKLGKRFEI